MAKSDELSGGIGANTGRRQPPVVATGENIPVRQAQDVAEDGGTDTEPVDPVSEPAPGLGSPRLRFGPNGEFLAGDHHHLSGFGQDSTPAGAHRHSQWESPHDHPRRAPLDPPAVIFPPLDSFAGREYDPCAQWTADRDFLASIEGIGLGEFHLMDFKAGQTVTGHVGGYLARTGAPVTRKEC